MKAKESNRAMMAEESKDNKKKKKKSIKDRWHSVFIKHTKNLELAFVPCEIINYSYFTKIERYIIIYI